MSTNPFSYHTSAAEQGSRAGPWNQQANRTSTQQANGTAVQLRPIRPRNATEFYDAYLRRSQNVTIGFQTYALVNKPHQSLPLELLPSDFKLTLERDLQHYTNMPQNLDKSRRERQAKDPRLSLEQFKQGFGAETARQLRANARLFQTAKEAKTRLERKVREWEEVEVLVERCLEALWEFGKFLKGLGDDRGIGGGQARAGCSQEDFHTFMRGT